MTFSEQITLILRDDDGNNHHDYDRIVDEGEEEDEEIASVPVCNEDRHNTKQQHIHDQQQQQFQRSTSTRKDCEGDFERESTIEQQNNTDKVIEVSCNSTATAERSQQLSSYNKKFLVIKKLLFD